jgi:succinate dehydrogenase / fumarate reductase cytochrome b subunit
VGLALRITRENNLARADSEQAQASLDTPPATGPTLAITGLVVLAFLVIHLIDFRVPNLAAEIDDLGGALVERLAQPLGAGLYLVGVLALGMHMWHAIPRAIQTLWPDPSRWSPLLRGLETTLPVLLTVGFASFPIYCLLTRAGGP